MKKDSWSRCKITIGTLRYQDGKLGRRQHWKSKTGTSPVVPAKNKILKRVVFSCIFRFITAMASFKDARNLLLESYNDVWRKLHEESRISIRRVRNVRLGGGCNDLGLPACQLKSTLAEFCFKSSAASSHSVPLSTVPFFVPVKGSTTNISPHNISSCTVFYTVGFLKIIIKINSWIKRNMWIRTEMFNYSTTQQEINNNYRVV